MLMIHTHYERKPKPVSSYIHSLLHSVAAQAAQGYSNEGTDALLYITSLTSSAFLGFRPVLHILVYLQSALES